MIEIILLLACCCFIFIVVLAGWFLSRGEEGDECEGKDKKGTYEIDEDLKCVLKSCDTKYYKSGKECLVDKSGVVCVPIGTPDPQGTYLKNRSNVCTLSSCATGYIKDGTTCTLDETFTIPTEADSLSECYGARYWDLRAAFGTDKAALGGHYTTYTTNGSETRSNSCTLSDEEAQCYLDRYPAVQAYAGTNLKLARKHYYEVGMGENKNFTCAPGVTELKCYGERYPDLQTAFGTDYAATGTGSTIYKLSQHWANHGKGEDRDFSCP